MIPKGYERPTRKFQIRPESPSQLLALRDLSLNLLYDGCWGTGKTKILAFKTLLMAYLYPGNKCCLIRRKRAHLEATTWKVLVDEVLPKQWVVRHNDTKLYRKLSNGSEIFGYGLDSPGDITILASHQYGFMGIEEAREIKEAQFDEQITRCLRLPGIPIHQCMLVTNPDIPEHWINKRFRSERWPTYNAIKGSMLTHLLPASYMYRVNQLTGVFRQRYKHGLWVGTEGMVYPWDPSHHSIGRFVVPKEWRREVALDWGYDNPFCCKWYAQSPEEHLGYPAKSWFMYREIYMTHRTVNVHAPQVRKYNELDGINPWVICDTDPNNRAIFKEHSIRTRNADKDRLAGQMAMQNLFDADQFYYFDDALVERDERLVENQLPWRSSMEFPGYVWMPGKDDMSDDDDHGMDTDRYFANTAKKKKRKGRAWA